MQAPRDIDEWARDKQVEEKRPEVRLKSARIPLEYLTSKWDDYDAACGIAESEDCPAESLKNILLDYVDRWEEIRPVGLGLLGAPGYGKSMGAAMLAKDLCLSGVWVKFITNTDLLERRKNLIHLEKEAERTDDFTAYNPAEYQLRFIENECDLLVLDDVGKEYRAKSGYADAGLDMLLRRRQLARKATIITSNLSMSDWDTYNTSMASFLHDVGEVLDLSEGYDHRASKSRSSRMRRHDHYGKR